MSTVVLKFIYNSGCYYKLIFSGPYPYVSVETKQCLERLKHSSRYQVSKPTYFLFYLLIECCYKSLICTSITLV